MKSRVSLFLFAFLPFFVIGFLSAGLMTRNQRAVIPVEAAGDQSSSVLVQKGFLLIQVSDLKDKSASVKSISFIFISNSYQSIIKIMPVFPSTDATRDALLASQFKLQNSKKLDSKFIEIMKTSFDFKWDGLFVYDQVALDDFSTWLAAQNNFSANVSQIPVVLSIEQMPYALCNYFQTHPEKGILNFSFSKDGDHHYFSNLTRKALSDTLAYFSPEVTPVSCEVIPAK